MIIRIWEMAFRMGLGYLNRVFLLCIRFCKYKLKHRRMFGSLDLLVEKKKKKDDALPVSEM